MIIPEPLVTVEKGRKKDNSLQREKKALLRAWYKQMQSANASAFDKKMFAEKMYREGSRLELPGLAVFLAKLVEEHTGRNPLKESEQAKKEKTKNEVVEPVSVEPSSAVVDNAEPASALQGDVEIPVVEPIAEVSPVDEEPAAEVVEAAVIEEDNVEETEDEEANLEEEVAEEDLLEEAIASLPVAVLEKEPQTQLNRNPNQQKIILMMGPPGAGKGTQARLLQKKDQILHLSTGDMLRERAKQEDELGLKIKDILAEGNYASDDLMIEMISERIAKPDCKVGFTLDGFPRTMPQVKALQKMLAQNKQEISCVVALDVADEAIPGRCAERLICEMCGESYHLTNRRPSFDLEKCNSREHDGQLVRRAEDTDPATVKRRIGKHHELTDPVLEYYESLDIVKHVNGEQPIYTVLRDVSQAVGVTL